MPSRPIVVCLVAVACAACRGYTSTTNQPPPARAKAIDASHRDHFEIEKSKLGPTGSSAYFSLVPGTVHTYREDETIITIRVLDETRVVDGVTTRVIEEREEDEGQPKEISRNFFAIDGATGDVYYFGEEVDFYRNGKITGHGGAWISGENGARFGLAMPGHPVVGDSYYQEIAPGVAMDRAEVVGLDERVETPAGVFEHCVKVRETTPIEAGVSFKWYAPGVGLVRDDDAVLVSR